MSTEPSVSFYPSGALVMHGQSDRIKFKSSDDAIRYRMLAMAFTKQFIDTAQDGTLFESLKKEAPLILAKLSEYAHVYHVNGVFVDEEFWQEGRENLIEIANPIFEFLNSQSIYEKCEVDEAHEVTVPNFIAHYQKWCKTYNVPAIDNRGGGVVKMLKTAWSHVYSVPGGM